MTVTEYLDSYIHGFIDSRRIDNPYKNLNEVLNFIGVLDKQNKIPFCRLPYTRPDKDYRHTSCGRKYFVPKNWRDCLYEDLRTRHFYIISPSPDNSNHNPEKVYSWIAFRVTDLMNGMQIYYGDNNGLSRTKVVRHTGSFIELIRECEIIKVLDTLAATEKPISISTKEVIRDSKGRITDIVCQFDID